MSSFIGTLQRTVGQLGPWFIRNKNIGKFLEAVELTFDGGIEALEQGLRLGQPLRCDVSALPVLSRDRGIRLYESESLDSQRYRLSQWWQLHRQRGTHQGEMRHGQPYFTPDRPIMRIVHQSGDPGGGAIATWHTLGSDGTYAIWRPNVSNWEYFPTASNWSRFFAILYPPASILSLAEYDGGALYDDGSTFYEGIALTQVALDLVAMIQEWKSAHSILWAYILATDPASFDPTTTAVTDPAGWTSLPVGGNWRAPLDGSGVFTRPPTALWIFDRGPS